MAVVKRPTCFEGSVREETWLDKQGVKCTKESGAHTRDAAAGAACMEFNKSGTRYSYMF